MSEKRYLDGPGFVEWLDRQVEIFYRENGVGRKGQLKTSLFSENGRRSIHRWAAGSRVDTLLGSALEDVLDSLNLQLWEVPEDLYRTKKLHKNRPDRQAVLDLKADGWSRAQIARKFGCSRDTIRYLLNVGDES